ncbi:MAG: ATP-binding cassette domain-containing protein [Polyangiaceae bacterium]|nr:ATP-binding cassette domain-containing protein [Polyangiaceae bacterium]
MSLEAKLAGRVGNLTIDVDLGVIRETLLLVGPNGAGKTTILRMLLGAQPVLAGRVAVDGLVLFDSAARVDLPPELRGLGYVPQGSGLFPHLSVLENVGFGLARTARTTDPKQRLGRARDALARLGIADLERRAPATLSGGERQRVAFARALVTSPRALLFDEPFSALDRKAKRTFRALLAEHLRSLAIPSIVVTHDPDDLEALGGEVAFIEEGRVVYRGKADGLAEARSPAVDDFLGLD